VVNHIFFITTVGSCQHIISIKGTKMTYLLVKLLSGEELYGVVLQYDDIMFSFQSSKQKFSSFSVTHNWKKWSILWELSYWKINIFYHNLDDLHVEKNMFENIFYTIMDVKGKTKDNINDIMDIPLFCYSKNIKLVYDESWVVKPKVNFSLDKNA
jgi:hypothetical protein